VSKRTRSIVKGAIAGLLGGIVGTAAKYAVERVTLHAFMGSLNRQP
jgi:tetrahydromethanopterin S-methyltransferase subunit D